MDSRRYRLSAMQTLYWDSLNPATGTPFTWDDPNLRWGDPSYILEPGDPGYTPPNPTTAAPARRTKRMKRQRYYPISIPDQIIWLENFRSKLGDYTAVLGLSAPQVAAAVADARWLVYLHVSWLPAVRAWSSSCTDAVKEAQSPNVASLMVLPSFTAPVLPDDVVAVNKGALDRIYALVQVLKEAPGYSDAIGTDLGTLGAGMTAPDLASVQPELQTQITGENVLIKWGWRGQGDYLDMCQIQVDRGSGWTLLAYDTTPNYTDTTAFPAVPTKWKYRAIYHVGDSAVGVWSSEVSVTVGG